MTQAKQPESLRLADRLQNAVATYPQVSEDEPGGYCQEVDQVMDEAAAELRRQHARIADLEAQLSAIGAGGVEPLRPRQCLHGISEPSGWRDIETAPKDGMDAEFSRIREDRMRAAVQASRAAHPAAPVAQGDGAEPVAYLWQHSETGRTRVVMPDAVITTDASWRVIGPLFLAASAQAKEGGGA